MIAHANVAVVGAGMIGLAHAYAAAKRGLKVVVFERHPYTMGTSVRNTGLVTTTSQYAHNLERVKQTRQTWLDIAPRAGIWYQLSGHLTTAHSEAEWQLLKEFANQSKQDGYEVTLFDHEVARAKLPSLNAQDLIGALWNPLAIKLDPREAIEKLTHWLARTYDITFYFNTHVRAITSQRLLAGDKQWQVDNTIVCAGTDAAYLFPYAFKNMNLCKIQMLRTEPVDLPFTPGVSSGLSLLHYPAYQQCKSIDAVREQFADTHAEHLHYGIHVTASQHSDNTITFGASHEYSKAPSPYDSKMIDDLLLQELQRLLKLPDLRIKERWSSVYPVATKQFTELIIKPLETVRVVILTDDTNISTSFALAEEVVSTLSGEIRHAA